MITELTDNAQGDAVIAKKMLKRLSEWLDLSKQLENVYGDGAYDGIEFRKAVEANGAKAVVPPPRNAVVHNKAEGALEKRNEAVLQILGLGDDELARKLWRKLSGYHRRSLVETMIYRLKQITGATLRSREWERQCIEAMR